MSVREWKPKTEGPEQSEFSNGDDETHSPNSHHGHVSAAASDSHPFGSREGGRQPAAGGGKDRTGLGQAGVKQDVSDRNGRQEDFRNLLRCTYGLLIAQYKET